MQESDVTEFVMVFRDLHGNSGEKRKIKRKFWSGYLVFESRLKGGTFLIRKESYIADGNIKLESWFILRIFCLRLRCATHD